MTIKHPFFPKIYGHLTCSWVQHPLAAADDSQKGPRSFVVPVVGEWFDGNVGEIG